MENARYQGKPLLKLADAYIFKAIGALTEAQERQLQEMAIDLRSLYQAGGDWHEIVKNLLGLPEDTPERLREAWKEFQQACANSGQAAQPAVFTCLVTKEWGLDQALNPPLS